MSTATTRPATLECRIDNLPAALRQYGQWVIWKHVWKSSDQKWDKPPVDPNTGSAASSTNPATWGRFEDLPKRLPRYDGCGFVVTESDPFVFIDIDGAVDPETGTIEEWGMKVLNQLSTYSEISPSGRGLRIIVKGNLDIEGCGKAWKIPKSWKTQGDKAEICVFHKAKYFTLTGHHVEGTPTEIAERTDEINALWQKLFPPPKRAEAKHAGNGRLDGNEKIRRARAYLTKVPPAISGQDGHDRTLAAACILTLGFDLSISDATPLILEYNERCDPRGPKPRCSTSSKTPTQSRGREGIC